MGLAEGEKLAQLLGSPITLKVGKLRYKVARMDLDMFNEWRDRLRELPFDAIEGKLKNVEDPELRKRLEARLTDEAVKKSEDDEYLSTQTETLEGVLILFSLMLRFYQPEITDKEVRALITAKGRDIVQKVVEKAAGTGDDEDDSKN